MVDIGIPGLWIFYATMASSWTAVMADIDETTYPYIQGRITAKIQSITTPNQSEVQSLLQEFPKLTRPRTEQPLVSNTKVAYIIDSGQKKNMSAKQFTALLQAGIIRPSKSLSSSHLILKSTIKNGVYMVTLDILTSEQNLTDIRL